VSEFKTPQGFVFGAVAAGIKKEGLDLGLICSERPATCGAVFTRNAFPAAPVILARENLLRSRHSARAILVNSGNANAANGEAGMAAARQCAEQVAVTVGCSPSEVFVSSTGVIGRPMPADKICGAVPGLYASLAPGNIDDFARAIMTTDTFPKIASAGIQGAAILGFAKGAGMIHPNMATMLSFIVTDAKIDYPDLDSALRDSVDRSFHCISVDGDTSTNDVVAVFANGASGVSLSPDVFAGKLLEVCQELAKSIVRDGEGASKFIELIIEGAPNDAAARKIGRTIARSPLVKTAIYGCDPNWGRLIAAIGNSGVPLSSDRIDLYIDDIPLNGGDLRVASERMAKPDVTIRASLHSGTGSARVWTCDLTEEYIRINADYTT
jgi:glutamate N-acetyltransferase/amino-acid N-acetyltransferase